MKKNNEQNYESIRVKLDKSKHPIAFENCVKSWVESGLSREEAEKTVETQEFEMEIYYDVFLGMFLVEADAVESITIYNPYTGDALEDFDYKTAVTIETFDDGLVGVYGEDGKAIEQDFVSYEEAKLWCEENDYTVTEL